MKTEKPNNPIAFPTLIYNQTTGEPNGHEKGMTLRDYFASTAINGMNVSGWFTQDYPDLAKRAYQLADAMLKEREIIDNFCECDFKNRNLDNSTYLVCKECDKKL